MILPRDRQLTLDLIREAAEAGAREGQACQIIEINVRTLRRWKRQLREEQGLKDKRKEAAAFRTPANKLTEDEKNEIIDICNHPQYRSLPPSQIVPQMADAGRYIASESSFYRVLRQVGQLHCRGRADVPRVVEKPKGYKAQAPNQVWSWDITYLASSIRGIFYYLYLVEDIYSRKIVAWEVHEKESAEHASVLIGKACLAESIHKEGLILHSDNGSPMKGATMMATLQKIGVIPSFSRPSVSDDNPYSESLFRTLKYTPAYPNKPFQSIAEARKWVHEFVTWYNTKHRHSAIRYVTPNQRHTGKDKEILRHRKEVYTEARKSNPQRWSRDIRNWTPVKDVWLNPPKELRADKKKVLKVS
jgi:putative transposase